MEKENASSHGTRSDVEHSIHELRNGMNSLLMNAAVLTSRAEDFPESLRPFLESISQAGQLCSKELTHLFTLIDSRTAR